METNKTVFQINKEDICPKCSNLLQTICRKDVIHEGYCYRSCRT